MAKNLYEFVATGQGDVIGAYEAIGAAAVRQAKIAEGAARRTERAGRGAAGAGRGGQGDAKYKEAERAAARYERELANEVRATERAEARKRSVQERASKANAQREERARRHVAGIRDRYQLDEQRKAEQADRARSRVSARVAAKETREKEARRKQSVETIKDLASGAVLGGAAAVAGTIAAATRESMALQESANRISINARKSGQGYIPASQLRRSFERTATETKGIRSQDVADAVGKFISLTGDVTTATKGQGVFATVASATGAGVGDVAEAAASLAQQFDITGLEDMKDVLAALTFQGKEGAFELKDAASQFQRLAASGAAFGIPKGVQGVKTLGGLTQIARTGTGSAEQAATAVENLLTNLKIKGDKLGAAGVNIYDKKTGKARDVRDLITESIAKVGGTDVAAKNAGLAKIFGEQGIRAINPLIAKYNDTFRETKGTDAEKTAAAMARLREEFAKSIDAAGDWDDVLEDSAQAQTDSSAQLTAAWERIKAGVGDKVIPALGDLVTKLAGDEGAAGILDPFIDATGAAVEVLNAFGQALYDTGIIKRKPKSYAEQQAAAEKELKRFDKKHGVGPLTADDAAARAAIEDKVTAASDALWGKGEKATPSTMTPEEFAKRYVDANPQGFSDAASGQDQALGLARRIQAGKGTPGTTEGNDWFMQTFGGENQAQTDIRRQYQGQAAGEGQVKTEDVQAALDAAAKAAERAAAAMGAVAAANQGTIFAGQ